MIAAFEPLPKREFFLYEKIKNVVSLRITELVDEITKLENSIDDIVDERTVPQFSDSLVIGNFDQVPILVANDGFEKIDYKGVKFHGLRSAGKAIYRIDSKEKEVCYLHRLQYFL